MENHDEQKVSLTNGGHLYIPRNQKFITITGMEQQNSAWKNNFCYLHVKWGLLLISE